MKIRNGFVSNSSSSSFIIIQKDTSLSEEELSKKTKASYRKKYGCSDFGNEKADILAKDGKFVLLIASVGYGNEEDAEEMAKSLCEIANIKNVSFEFGDY